MVAWIADYLVWWAIIGAIMGVMWIVGESGRKK